MRKPPDARGAAMPRGSLMSWGRLGTFLLAGAAMCGAGLIAAVLVAGLMLSAPSRVPAGPASEGAEAVAFNAADATTLRGWFMPGRPGAGAVVLMHGVHASRRQMLRRAVILRDLGFAVLLFDFRAHGESDGQRITFGAREALDAAAAIGFLRARLPGERIGAIGASLGGAAALLGPGPLAIDALVLEAVYPDIGRALEARLRVVLGGHRLAPLANPVLTPLFLRLMPLVTGVRAAELRPIDRIGAVHGPVLVASGTADDRTPIVEARALFHAAQGIKEFWAVPGARHEDLQAFDPEAYRARVVGFLMTWLRPEDR